MFVYVISAADLRQKVGKARDPEERRRLLQNGSSDPLVLVHFQHVANALGVEGLAHKKLEPFRLRGEWFAVTTAEAEAAVREAVDELGGETPPPTVERRMPRKVVDGVGLEARRAAVRDYHARRAESGLKKVTLWLSPEARFKLDALKAAAGSKDKAAELAIMAWPGPGLPSAPKPKAKAAKPPAASAQASIPASLQLGPTRAKAGALLKGGKK